MSEEREKVKNELEGLYKITGDASIVGYNLALDQVYFLDKELNLPLLKLDKYPSELTKALGVPYKPRFIFFFHVCKLWSWLYNN